MHIVKVGNYQVGQGHPLLLMAGGLRAQPYDWPAHQGNL